MEEIKNGVTVIDADTLLVKDDYCTFYLHRPAPSEMTWFDAMYWVNSKGWSLPDRWQGLTIARYRDEIVKHFGEPRDWWLWTCEEFEFTYDGAWAGAYYVDIYYGNVGDNNKWSTAAVLAVSALEKQKEQQPVHTAKEMWKEMRLEVYAQASGNRHEPNYSDDSTKMFSLRDIDEIFEKIGNSIVGLQPAEWSDEDEEILDAMIDIVSNSLYEPLCPREGMLAWLKSIKNRGNFSKSNTNSPSWKPSGEQPELTCKTCDYYENDCPFTRGKFIVYPNKVCKDYKEQSQVADASKIEQPEGGYSEKPNDLLSEQEPTCKDYTHFADVGKMEQPEVDLEKEIDRLWDSLYDELEGPHNKFEIYARCAHHFYELGLNARKGDSK